MRQGPEPIAARRKIRTKSLTTTMKTAKMILHPETSMRPKKTVKPTRTEKKKTKRTRKVKRMRSLNLLMRLSESLSCRRTLCTNDSALMFFLTVKEPSWSRAYLNILRSQSLSRIVTKMSKDCRRTRIS